MAGKKTKTLDPVRFGENLRRIRKERGWTHEKLADLIDKQPRTVYYYEAGKKVPSIQIVCDLANALGANVSDLLF